MHVPEKKTRKSLQRLVYPFMECPLHGDLNKKTSWFQDATIYGQHYLRINLLYPPALNGPERTDITFGFQNKSPRVMPKDSKLGMRDYHYCHHADQGWLSQSLLTSVGLGGLAWRVEKTMFNLPSKHFLHT